MSWQPIETAPKVRGQKLLTYGKLRGSYGYSSDDITYSISEWSGDGWSSQRSLAFGNNFNPTHWMPLPEPPQESQP